MAVIHILDKHTAELIAAGEVVERPASAVKELLENAIDAGATQITVAIESGGVKLIEVSDNGSGIEAEYIGAAFIRHATSKISQEADLEHIHTLGFRGEALASIASVARVEVLTKTEQDEFACRYRIEGGEELGMEPGARGVGTTIRVRDLFYNTPARMKFLKKDASEGTYVADVVGHVALSHPEIRFKFIREGKLQYTTAGDGKLLSAAYAVLGREFARDLLPVDGRSGNYRVRGLITPPKSCRASRSMQRFYINGRYVRNRTMMAAMETAFKGTTMQGKFPGGILLLEMPVELVDVNVHPAKTEVRFAWENDVFDAVYHAVKLALAQPGSGERMFRFDSAQTNDSGGKGENTSEIDEKQDSFTGLSAVVAGQSAPGTLDNRRPAAEPDAAAAWGEVPAAVSAQQGRQTGTCPEPESFPPAALSPEARRVVIPAEQPLAGAAGLRSPAAGFPLASANEALLDIRPEAAAEGMPDALPDPEAAGAGPGLFGYAVPEAGPKPPENAPEGESPAPARAASAGPEQAKGPIAAPVQTALWEENGDEPLQYVGEVFKTYIIAQRGDELCLIDKHAAHERILFEQLAANYGAVDRQILLAPVVVTLSAEEKQAILENTELLENAGLEADDFGGNSIAVRAVPCDVEAADVADLAVELAAKLAAGSRDALNERTEWVLHSISCRAAIKAGDRNPPEQLMHLAEAILSGKVPPFCPHGRPCVLKLTRKELEKQFGRTL